jgi:serine/threonine-protein phosphatase 2B catalytic subunit
MMNGHLPIFKPTDVVTDFLVIPVPSMRRKGSGDSMEDLIRQILEEPDNENAGMVERVSERIASGRKVTGKPMPLKRYETT